jgi:uncharacterized protein with GYD domain
MPKYLLTASYSHEGQKGLLREGGSARVTAMDAVIRRVGGKMESYYFALGGHDVYVTAELPNNAAAVAVGATIGASGAISKFETVALMGPEEVDAAVKLSPIYRPPGH